MIKIRKKNAKLNNPLFILKILFLKIKTNLIFRTKMQTAFIETPWEANWTCPYYAFCEMFFSVLKVQKIKNQNI